LFAASGDDVDQIEVDVVDDPNPEFDEFTVTVTDVAGGSGNIQEVTSTGNIFNSDPNGEIQITLLNNGNEFGQGEIEMSDSFSISQDPDASNQDSLGVQLTLLDQSGNLIPGQDCVSDEEVTENNDLTDEEFTCN